MFPGGTSGVPKTMKCLGGPSNKGLNCSSNPLLIYLRDISLEERVPLPKESLKATLLAHPFNCGV